MIEKRKRGKHLENKETKAGIIKFILGEPEKVSEPEIRKYLKNEKFNVIDQGTINKHLHFLSEKLKCIEPVSTIKQGVKSYWNITNIIKLRNIEHEFPKKEFPDIKLNTHEKTITLVLKESGYSINSIEGLDFYIQLHRSASFFNACLETDIGTLRERARNVYLRDKGFKTNQLIKKLQNEFYTAHIKGNLHFEMPEETFQEEIKKIDDRFFGFSAITISKSWDEILENLATKISMDDLPISVDVLQQIEEEATRRINDRSLLRCIWNEYLDEYLEKIFPDWANTESMSLEILLKTHPEIIKDICYTEKKFLKEIFEERIYSKIYKEIFKGWSKGKETPIDVFMEAMDESQKMYTKIKEIWQLKNELQNTFQESGFGLQLEHFLKHDILIGVDPDEEFEKTVNEVIEDFNSKFFSQVGCSYSNDYMSNLLTLTIASEFISRYKQPAIFHVSEDPKIILEFLKDYYKDQIL